jgi:gamma-glutamylcyclotransferase (GGCT)/AIG2-like uncharacterized protein YtfP
MVTRARGPRLSAQGKVRSLSYTGTMTDARFIFVYGLLMRGRELHHHMEGAQFAGEGTTRGTLVSLGRFPALIAGDGAVHGELYRFDDMPGALDVLDDVEEFDATDPDASLYVRVVRPVHMSDGTDVDAWVYLYNRDTKGAPRIKSGDWRRT